MKISASILPSLLLALCTTAQRIAIGSPANKVTVSAGSQLLVEVDKPNSLSGSTEVAIVIGMNPCPATTRCNPAENGLGHILYNGPYAPKYADGALGKPPHQNFTVTVPSNLEGRALLAVFHANLIGANPSPFTEIVNVTLNIRAAA